MQQKVAIACALVANPPIVLLDEPTLGLDVQAAVTVKEWIKTLSREQARTIILTTHQLDMAEELCERVAIIRKGRLLTDQRLGDLLAFHKEHYQIRVKGHLDEQLIDLPEGMSCEYENEETLLVGAIEDPMALYSLLSQLRAMNLPLLAVDQVEPNLEEVFINMINEAKQGENHELLSHSV